MDSKEIVMQSKPGSALLLTLKSAVTLDRLCCERWLPVWQIHGGNKE